MTRLAKTKMVALSMHEDQHPTLKALGGSGWVRAAIADAVRKAHAIRKRAIAKADGDIKAAQLLINDKPWLFVPPFATTAQTLYWEGVLRITKRYLAEAAAIQDLTGDMTAYLDGLDALDPYDLPADARQELTREKVLALTPDVEWIESQPESKAKRKQREQMEAIERNYRRQPDTFL